MTRKKYGEILWSETISVTVGTQEHHGELTVHYVDASKCAYSIDYQLRRHKGPGLFDHGQKETIRAFALGDLATLARGEQPYPD